MKRSKITTLTLTCVQLLRKRLARVPSQDNVHELLDFFAFRAMRWDMPSVLLTGETVTEYGYRCYFDGNVCDILIGEGVVVLRAMSYTPAQFVVALCPEWRDALYLAAKAEVEHR